MRTFIYIFFFDTVTKVILSTRWHERFFGSRVHNRIPPDVTFIDTRHDFSPSMVHPIGAEAGKATRGISALSPSQLYFSCLPSPSSFFHRSPLSKPVIAADEYGEYSNANDATPNVPIKPVDFIGSPFEASRIAKSR